MRWPETGGLLPDKGQKRRPTATRFADLEIVCVSIFNAGAASRASTPMAAQDSGRTTGRHVSPAHPIRPTHTARAPRASTLAHTACDAMPDPP